MNERARVRSTTYIVPANSILPLDITGNNIGNFAANGNLSIRFDNETITEFPQGMSYPNHDFNFVELINESDADITTTIVYGQGDYVDRRLSLAGQILVEAPADKPLQITSDTPLQINSADLLNKLTDLENLLKNDELKRQGLTTLEGATYAEARNETKTVVSAAENTNGVIIRLGHATSNVSTGFSEIRVGDGVITLRYFSGGNILASEVRNIYVPAGVPVELFSNHQNYTATIWFEVLS